MSAVFQGDEWKYGDPVTATGPTRAQEQARVDADYATGRITREQWLVRFAELSDLATWCGKGRLPSNKR